MMGRDYVLELFAQHAGSADLCLVEGVMGLFDGAGPAGAEGSTAEIAGWLEAPVLLVSDARGMGRSLAAMIGGYSRFQPGLAVAGVIANRIGSQAHGRLLAEALEAESLPPLVGGVLRGAFPALPSRHLGLVTADRNQVTPALLDQLADALEQSVCLDSLVKLAEEAPELPIPPAPVPPVPSRPVRIGLARDAAFHFYYQDLLDSVEARGAELVPFSPVEDGALPDDLGGLYLGGGYPEAAVEALSANRGMLESIRRFAARGRPVYAECGGLMFLSRGVETLDGQRRALVGLLPGWTRMRERRQALGYVEVTLEGDSLWGARGTRLRGHEFHYSEWVGEVEEPWTTAYSLRRRAAGDPRPEGLQNGRTLASYVHVHYASRPQAVDRFIQQCGGSL